MTTIAFDGVTLAADTRRTFGVTPKDDTTKIHTFSKGPWKYGAAAGDVFQILAFYDYLEGNREDPGLTDDDAIVLVVNEAGQAYAINHLNIPYQTPVPWAIGTGGDYAMGAMHAGKTAVEAVQIASKLDVNTGPEVRHVRVTE